MDWNILDPIFFWICFIRRGYLAKQDPNQQLDWMDFGFFIGMRYSFLIGLSL
jgi:hypothetical protein